MKKLLLLLVLVSSLFAKMQFSDPQPTFIHPRKWLIKLHIDDIHRVNHTLGGIYNVLNIYPPESLHVLVVAYGSGDRVLMKNYDKHTLKRIQSLMSYGVKFVVCEMTMKTMGWKKKDFIKGVSYVKAGIADVIEKKQAGWIDVTPY
jgi:uncharacterized protein